MKKNLKLLAISLSLLGAFSCKNGPKVTVCISDPAAFGMWCSNGDDLSKETKDKMAKAFEGRKKSTYIPYVDAVIEEVKATGSFLPFEQSDNFVCFNPDDARKLFEYCKLK